MQNRHRHYPCSRQNGEPSLEAEELLSVFVVNIP
jgi:hypothetical protein